MKTRTWLLAIMLPAMTAVTWGCRGGGSQSPTGGDIGLSASQTPAVSGAGHGASKLTAAAGGIADCAGGKLDPATNLCWQEPPAPGKMNWPDAVAYCDALTLAGHSNWSLPGAEMPELLGGCNEDWDVILSGETVTCRSCELSDRCNRTLGLDEGVYWLSPSGWGYYGDFSLRADMGSGTMSWHQETEEYHVRCVRAH